MCLHTQEDLPAFPVELLIPTKTNPEFHLASLFSPSTNVDAEILIAHAATVYAFPTDPVEITYASHTDSFVIPDALSFRDPRDIRLQEEA